MLILYGSQTGSAQSVAERIRREALRRARWQRDAIACRPMDDYYYDDDDDDDDDPKGRRRRRRRLLSEEPLVIFVCSTTGQGDEPDNMRRFWRYLRRRQLPPHWLASTEFTVFGLGDSSYAKYNFAARKLFRRLEQLGAKCFYPKGEGDDQHPLGYDGTLDPWLKGLWELLMARYPLLPGMEVIPDDTLSPPQFILRPVSLDKISGKESRTIWEWEENATIPVGAKAFPARLLTNRRITAQDHFQDVRHIELDISGSDLRYNPGDVAAIQPANVDEDVEGILKLIGMESIADGVLSIEPNTDVGVTKLPHFWPPFLSLRRLLKYHLDFTCVPRRYFFELLSFFAGDQREQERLKEFASAAGQEELYSYCNRPRRTCVEVLQEFTSVRIPLAYVAEVFSPIQPRMFSISSSQLAHPSQIHLTVVIVNYQTKIKKPRTGLCTRWLAQLERGAVVPVWCAPGTMELPASNTTPIVMIGPGTGCAPFRAFLQYRSSLNSSENYLFFGCRNRGKDHLYEDEMNKYESNGQLRCFTAYSRDQEEKRYVQHCIREQSSLLWRLLSETGSFIYICGNAKRMPQDVEDAIVDVIEKEGDLSRADAKQFLRMCETSRHFQTETWS